MTEPKDGLIFFTSYLAVGHGMETCTECPALVRGDHCLLLLHVHDVLMIGDPSWIIKEFLPKLKENFKVSFQIASKLGQKVEFLKRKHTLVEDGVQVTPSSKNVNDVIESLSSTMMAENGELQRVLIVQLFSKNNQNHQPC